MAPVDQADAEPVRLLLQRGAFRTVENDEGDTPLKIAAAAGHDDVAEVINSHGGEFSRSRKGD